MKLSDFERIINVLKSYEIDSLNIYQSALVIQKNHYVSLYNSGLKGLKKQTTLFLENEKNKISATQQSELSLNTHKEVVSIHQDSKIPNTFAEISVTGILNEQNRLKELNQYDNDKRLYTVRNRAKFVNRYKNNVLQLEAEIDNLQNTVQVYSFLTEKQIDFKNISSNEIISLFERYLKELG